MTVYADAIADLDQRIQRLQDARAVLVSLNGSDAPTRPVVKRRPSGTHALILDVVREGSDKIDAIAKAAKVKHNTARVAVLELERAGKVKREGKGRSTRYVSA